MRPTWAEIDLGAIAFNLQGICHRVKPAGIMAVVKADAYGHGALQVSRVALQEGAAYLAVAVVDEAVALRKGGIEAPILVFGGFSPEDAPLFLDWELDATLFDTRSTELLRHAAQQRNRPTRVHIKVDTGMGRLGIPWQEAAAFAAAVRQAEGLELTGLYTHFATSDALDKSFANLQLIRFKTVVEALESQGIRIPLKHAANSAAILDMPGSYFDMVRPGIMMYGQYPSTETTESIEIRPAMSFKTAVSQVKTILRGESVSYGRTFIADRPTTIATLPVGYADGYNRLLSNRGEVLIRGRRCPVAGRVCMDLIMAAAGDEVQVGDEAVLFGRQGDAEISVASICQLLGTIPYEVTCWVSKRVPRVYIHDRSA
ncbi:MAG TPA: alanine racemase [bacterium]|nr:alanine racemase [bacterium]HQI48719.1 alanine racemase [bacterium]HQJ63701.1 alanine racemase [bacterium]